MVSKRSEVMASGSEGVMVIQDQFGDGEMSPSDVFFEMANESVLAYRILDSSQTIELKQDPNSPRFDRIFMADNFILEAVVPVSLYCSLHLFLLYTFKGLADVSGRLLIFFLCFSRLLGWLLLLLADTVSNSVLAVGF